MKKPANIKQVATQAGVSIATVSRALQHPDKVAPETLERVLTTVRTLSYYPNAHARGLRTDRSKLVIALVPDLGNSFFSEVIKGIEDIARTSGYAVLIGNTEYDKSREEGYAQLLSMRRVDGMITLLPHLPPMRGARRSEIVNACEYVSDNTVSSVYVDNVNGAKMATAYLLALGHRSIAFINGRTSPISTDRESGYRAVLQQNGIRVDDRLIVSGDFGAGSGVRSVETLLARGTKFTAIFAASDEMALGAISALRSRGKRIPKDVSVIGFDDIRLSRYFDPPLTTVAQPKGELGEEAMRMLLDLMTNPDTPVRKQILPPQLVVRGSATAPAR